jgi:hypothetical protein
MHCKKRRKILQPNETAKLEDMAEEAIVAKV